ncbi:MAG: DUF2283 domain-containing protein [Leptolyngbyaceae cyanobacterium RM2_2_4]|nr:DUF2283 domain-containing protein [Leptolyngbyaceae cyanobacterium SM1_4_3]NJN90747.1 DUF2283 domain-containing protein [Leptolyngbyaceae cyanobacterium SL_5_14]NJO50961.1 DUF2283 domain-containing protein [Leptolyngbyaceae cyanobacterium RM2_2_4]
MASQYFLLLLGVILDYDKDGQVVGIEILNASKRIANLSTLPTA